MHTDQILILVILACTVGLFLWGRWRHDIVAGASLLACGSWAWWVRATRSPGSAIPR